jgi:hypothetical protein
MTSVVVLIFAVRSVSISRRSLPCRTAATRLATGSDATRQAHETVRAWAK